MNMMLTTTMTKGLDDFSMPISRLLSNVQGSSGLSRLPLMSQTPKTPTPSKCSQKIRKKNTITNIVKQLTKIQEKIVARVPCQNEAATRVGAKVVGDGTKLVRDGPKEY